jgi:hypothetical protein
LKSAFAQSRLTEGDLKAGRSINNEESIRAKLIEVYQELSDLALVQSGQQAVNFFSENTTVDINLAQRSVTITGVLPIVTQLGTIDYSLALSFDIGQTGTQIVF